MASVSGQLGKGTPAREGQPLCQRDDTGEWGLAGTQRGHPAPNIRAGCLGAKPSHKSAEDCAGLESPRRNRNGLVSRGNTIGPSGISRMDLIPPDHCRVSAWRVMSRGCRARRIASSPTLQPWGGRAPGQAWGMVRKESFSHHPMKLKWLRVPRGAQLGGSWGSWPLPCRCRPSDALRACCISEGKGGPHRGALQLSAPPPSPLHLPSPEDRPQDQRVPVDATGRHGVGGVTPLPQPPDSDGTWNGKCVETKALCSGGERLPLSHPAPTSTKS